VYLIKDISNAKEKTFNIFFSHEPEHSLFLNLSFSKSLSSNNYTAVYRTSNLFNDLFFYYKILYNLATGHFVHPYVAT